MARTIEFFAQRLLPSLKAERVDLFSELREFWLFLREELKPFPGRQLAMVRLVASVIAALLISQTLRVPNPAFTAYLVFFIASDDGISSVRVGLASMVSLTLALVLAMGVNICFIDAPWFRLPVTFFLIAGALWLSRTLVMGVLARLAAVILALYLSLADVIFDPESLTEATLWLWPGVAISVGVTTAVSLLLEPRPDLLLREEIVAGLESVRRTLDHLASGLVERPAEARALRRQVYAAPQRMRQLLARWRQRVRPPVRHDVDWELAILITERLLAAAAALATSDLLMSEEETRRALARLAGTTGELKRAVQERDHEAIRSLAVPSMETLPDSDDKPGLVLLAATLADSRLVLTSLGHREDAAPAKESPHPQHRLFVPDAWTNPEYARFTIKATLAILACEIFMNAVAWPGIRTSMITCAVTALATVGAQRQKQLLRLAGACVGGLMGLGAILYIIPQLDSIVGLALLITAGTACCAWVAAGSVRSSYAGFQMALAFFIMLLPGFDTSIDLAGIRDRFVGILVGITAMWIFFDHLWHTSSRQQLVDKLIGLLQVMARGPGLVSPGMNAREGRERVMAFRRELYAGLSAGRLLFDETKIELTLTLNPPNVRGRELEIMAREVSFAGFLLTALCEQKLRSLALGNLSSVQPLLQPADDALTRNLTSLAEGFRRFQESLPLRKEHAEPSFPPIGIEAVPAQAPGQVEFELRSLYQMLQGCIRRIADLNWMVRALP